MNTFHEELAEEVLNLIHLRCVEYLDLETRNELLPSLYYSRLKQTEVAIKLTLKRLHNGMQKIEKRTWSCPKCNAKYTLIDVCCICGTTKPK